MSRQISLREIRAALLGEKVSPQEQLHPFFCFFLQNFASDKSHVAVGSFPCTKYVLHTGPRFIVSSERLAPRPSLSVLWMGGKFGAQTGKTQPLLVLFSLVNRQWTMHWLIYMFHKNVKQNFYFFFWFQWHFYISILVLNSTPDKNLILLPCKWLKSQKLLSAIQIWVF